MPFWRIVPPPPRPWAQSVAPAALVGRRIAANPPRPAGAAARTHTRAPSPQGVGSQPKWLHTTNAPPIIAPCKPPPRTGVPRRERWRTVPPSPPPARPPPLTGWISIGLHTTNALPFIAPLQIPPLPHPYWAQSVAPAGWQGRVPRQSRPPLPPCRGCRPHPSRAPSPQGAGSLQIGCIQQMPYYL